MSKALTQRIDPINAADKGRRYEGSIALSLLSRLSPLLVGDTGDAHFQLQFMRDGRWPAVQGTVGAELRVACQCCLQPMRLNVEQSFLLVVVESLDEIDALPEGAEPLLVNGDDPEVTVLEIIEDELLLAVPHVVQHRVCESIRQEQPVHPAQSGEPHAFADLASLVQTKEQ